MSPHCTIYLLLSQLCVASSWRETDVGRLQRRRKLLPFQQADRISSIYEFQNQFATVTVDMSVLQQWTVPDVGVVGSVWGCQVPIFMVYSKAGCWFSKCSCIYYFTENFEHWNYPS